MATVTRTSQCGTATPVEWIIRVQSLHCQSRAQNPHLFQDVYCAQEPTFAENGILSKQWSVPRVIRRPSGYVDRMWANVGLLGAYSECVTPIPKQPWLE